jgi:hypothetical protein
MKLKFLKAQEIDKSIKATIQATGKLGLSSQGAAKMDLEKFKVAMIAVNEEDPNDENLYVKLETESNENGFKIVKAGDYFSINTTKAFFDDININYMDKKIIFDIVEFEYEGDKMYKFLK